MHVTRDVDVAVTPERLWTTLWDVSRMVTCLPGCGDVREVEPHRRYAARMTQRVGPMTLSVPLDVTVSRAQAPSALAFEAKGRDTKLGADIAVSVTLDVTPTHGGSRLRIDAQGQILGKLGALGHGVIQQRAAAVIDEFGDRLRRAMED